MRSKKFLLAASAVLVLSACDDRAKLCQDLVSRGVTDSIAMKHCEVAAEKGDALSQAYYGVVLESMGNHKDAERYYFRAIRSKKVEAVRAIVENAMNKGNLEDVIKYASVACDLGDQEACNVKNDTQDVANAEAENAAQAAALKQEREAFEKRKAETEASLKAQKEANEQALLRERENLATLKAESESSQSLAALQAQLKAETEAKAEELRREREALERQKLEVQHQREMAELRAQLNNAKSEAQRRERERLEQELKAVRQQNNSGSSSIYSTTSAPVAMPSYSAPATKTSSLKFNEGVAYYKADNGLYGYMNQVGSIVIAPKFKDAGGFYNGLAVVQRDDGLWGYINKSGQYVIRPNFCMAGRFSEGLAAVYVGGYKSGTECYGGKWGFITVTGKMAIEPKFDRAWYFSKDNKGVAKAKVEINGMTGYINGRGQWVN